MQVTIHTPGPWVYQDESVRQEESGAIVAEVGPAFGAGASARRSANAALISAAPELLAALELITKWCEVSGFGNSTRSKQWTMLESARAAIAKARG